MEQYALVQNGKIVPCDIDSKQWLKNAPRGRVRRLAECWHVTADSSQQLLYLQKDNLLDLLTSLQCLVVDTDLAALGAREYHRNLTARDWLEQLLQKPAALAAVFCPHHTIITRR